MPGKNGERLIGELELVRRLRPGAARAERLLDRCASVRIDDAALLVRLHDALLFLRAHPHGAGVLRRADALLDGFAARVARLEAKGADLTPLDAHEVSGISGTTITMSFSHDFSRWLARRAPGSAEIAWDAFEGFDRLGTATPKLLPLLDEEALADANVPYRAWLEAARGRKSGDLAWALDRLSPQTLFDALAPPVRWRLGESRFTRTRARLTPKRAYFQEGPFRTRHDVSLASELAGEPLPIRRLSARAGESILDAGRAAMGVRYRELYGFTEGDPANVVAADVGRGTEIFLAGLLPERRLPIRAGYAALVLRNGVPVAYGDAFAVFERLEVSFNVFYAFREGESAWIYARLLRVYRQALGSASFSIDPYQIGMANDEAIDSGAFWFYRKLGFRSTDPTLEAVARREETRLAADGKYRTPARVLRRLAGANLLFSAGGDDGAWDRFHIRNLGLSLQRRIASAPRGEEGFRREALGRVARALGIAGSRADRLPDLALVLALVPRLETWSAAERSLLRRILDAKRRRPESEYLRLLNAHPRLRASLLALGSEPGAPRLGAARAR